MNQPNGAQGENTPAGTRTNAGAPAQPNSGANAQTNAQGQRLLYASLAENLKWFDDIFGASADYYAKPIEIAQCKAAVILMDGIAGTATLWTVLLDALNRGNLFWNGETYGGRAIFEKILYHSDLAAEKQSVKTLEEFTARITSGHAVLLLDGCVEGIAFSVQMLRFRSVGEPAGEGNLRGSREGFTDLMRINLGLLRRLHRGETLVLEVATANTPLKTEYALCYDSAKVSPALLAAVREKLEQATPELLLDSSYFIPWLSPRRFRLFTPVYYTERPVVAVAKLREGKVVVLVNGSPSALVAPALFAEHFESLDDYGGTAYFASFIRVLKYISFLLTVLLPGLFVMVASDMPQLIPTELLYKIMAAEQATPLPLFGEMLLVILLLEIIREAGLRMPQSLGHSVSLVAALIIGDAAISAGIMSTPVILIAAITSIAMFVTPTLYEPATVLRILFVLAAGLAGPVGVVFLLFALVLTLCDLSLFGVPYFLARGHALWRDGVIRRNYRVLSQRAFDIQQVEREGKG